MNSSVKSLSRHAASTIFVLSVPYHLAQSDSYGKSPLVGRIICPVTEPLNVARSVLFASQ